MFETKTITMDLQLFAEYDPNMMTTTSPNLTAESENMKFYSKDLIETAQANLVHTQFAEHKPFPKGTGKTIEWRKWSHFKKALKPLEEGKTPQASALSVGTISKKLEQFGDYSIVTDVLDMTAIDDNIIKNTERHAMNMAATLDTIARNELITGTQVIYAPIIASDGAETEVTSRAGLTKNAKLTLNLIAKAVSQLKKNNAPKIDGSYICIIHPSVSFDIMTHKDWIDIQKYSNTVNIFNGEIGKLYGVRFIESTEAAILVGADLTADSRAITATKIEGNVVTINAITASDAEALEGREILLYSGTTYEHAVIESATTTSITLTENAISTAVTKIYPGEGGKETDDEKCAVYACMFMGKGAYGDVQLDGGSAEVIVKTANQSGTEDPLNQRNTIGWKCTGYAAKILIPEYLVRVECGSSFSGIDDAN